MQARIIEILEEVKGVLMKGPMEIE